MSIGGGAHSAVLADISKDEAFKLLDTFYDTCGNFVDTSDNYQDGQSEEWLGEWMEACDIRDQMVVATKHTMSHQQHEIDQKGKVTTVVITLNHSIDLSATLSESLGPVRRHWWDYTSIEEIMHSLHDVVRSRMVLYLGISNAPAWIVAKAAWIVAKANQYARDHTLTPFVIYQGLWNVMVRDMSTILFHEGLAIAPWGSVGQCKFKTKAQIEALKQTDELI